MPDDSANDENASRKSLLGLWLWEFWESWWKNQHANFYLQIFPYSNISECPALESSWGYRCSWALSAGYGGPVPVVPAKDLSPTKSCCVPKCHLKALSPFLLCRAEHAVDTDQKNLWITVVDLALKPEPLKMWQKGAISWDFCTPKYNLKICTFYVCLQIVKNKEITRFWWLVHRKSSLFDAH